MKEERTVSTKEKARAWRYSINYGPEGEANYAMVYDADDVLVSNLKTYHAISVVNAMNAALSATEDEAEPVAWRVRPLGDKVWHLSNDAPRLGYEGQPLYASPPSAPSAPAGVKVRELLEQIVAMREEGDCKTLVEAEMTGLAQEALRLLQPDTQEV